MEVCRCGKLIQKMLRGNVQQAVAMSAGKLYRFKTHAHTHIHIYIDICNSCFYYHYNYYFCEGVSEMLYICKCVCSFV